MGQLVSCALLQTLGKSTHSCNIRFDTQGAKATFSARTQRTSTPKLPLLCTLDQDPVTEVDSPLVQTLKVGPSRL